jgi:hypothetical protein
LAAGPRALQTAPNNVFTPHVSGRSDISHAVGLDLFVEGLAGPLRHELPANAIDWTRGY